MSDIIKFEYIKLLDEFEYLSNIFDELEEETQHLKKEYQKNPNDQQLLAYIKLHEEKYRQIHEKFKDLNIRSKELRIASENEKKDKK